MATTRQPTGFEGSLRALNPPQPDGRTVTDANIVVPGGTIMFSFSNAPPDASAIRLVLYESVFYLGGAHRQAYAPSHNGDDGPEQDRRDVVLAEIAASTSGGRLGSLRVERVSGWGEARMPFQRAWLRRHLIQLRIDQASDFMLNVWLEQPHRVYDHQLYVRVGALDDTGMWRWTTQGPTQPHHHVHVDYPIGGVAGELPPHTPPHDVRSFRYARPWFGQWQAYGRGTRSATYVIARPPPNVVAVHAMAAAYGPTVDAIATEAGRASSGVVLVSGHGGPRPDDPNPNATDGWFEFVPHNVAPGTSNLRIHKTDLLVGARRRESDDTATAQRLLWLDRLSYRLKATRIRLLILHGCNAGRDPAFLQLLADRLEVPVASHTCWVVYEGPPQPAPWRQMYRSLYEWWVGPPVNALRTGAPLRPRDLYWPPVTRLADVAYPRGDASLPAPIRYWTP